MRLWTVHPKYLDAKGLVALWREGLLAKAVLEGKTKGYRKHPQLERFREQPDPVSYVSEYLRAVLGESLRRGYKFSAGKIPGQPKRLRSIKETDGQLSYEWGHLLSKLRVRDQELFQKYAGITLPDPHPLFTMVRGGIRSWEKFG